VLRNSNGTSCAWHVNQGSWLQQGFAFHTEESPRMMQQLSIVQLGSMDQASAEDKDPFVVCRRGNNAKLAFGVH
jgi:hypothetical protein